MTRLIGFLLTASFVMSLSPAAHAVSMAPFDARPLSQGENRLVFAEASLMDFQHLLAKCGPPKPGQDPCQNMTTIHIAVPLYGCLDDVVATTNSSVNKATGKITVNVTALTIVNEASETARCGLPPVRIITVVVRSSLQKVKGVNVDFQRRFADVH